MTLFSDEMEAASKERASKALEKSLERIASLTFREALTEKRIAAYRERQAGRLGLWARLKARLGVL